MGSSAYEMHTKAGFGLVKLTSDAVMGDAIQGLVEMSLGFK